MKQNRQDDQNEPQQSMHNYLMRGSRVEALDQDAIEFIAHISAKSLGLKKSTKKNMGLFIDKLHEHGITYDVVDDSEWLGITNAMCYDGTIHMPASLYTRICELDTEAIFILFHELGHLLLGHKAMLHHSDILSTQNEDSEWQADEFSKYMMRIMGIKFPEQLSLRF